MLTVPSSCSYWSIILYKIYAHTYTHTHTRWLPWFGQPLPCSPGTRPYWSHPGMPSCSSPGSPKERERKPFLLLHLKTEACALSVGEQVRVVAKQDHPAPPSISLSCQLRPPSVIVTKTLGSSSGLSFPIPILQAEKQRPKEGVRVPQATALVAGRAGTRTQLFLAEGR